MCFDFVQSLCGTREVLLVAVPAKCGGELCDNWSQATEKSWRVRKGCRQGWSSAEVQVITAGHAWSAIIGVSQSFRSNPWWIRTTTRMTLLAVTCMLIRVCRMTLFCSLEISCSILTGKIIMVLSTIPCLVLKTWLWVSPCLGVVLSRDGVAECLAG